MHEVVRLCDRFSIWDGGSATRDQHPSEGQHSERADGARGGEEVADHSGRLRRREKHYEAAREEHKNLVGQERPARSRPTGKKNTLRGWKEQRCSGSSVQPDDAPTSVRREANSRLGGERWRERRLCGRLSVCVMRELLWEFASKKEMSFRITRYGDELARQMTRRWRAHGEDVVRHRQTQTDRDRHRQRLMDDTLTIVHTDRHRQTQTDTDRHKQTDTDRD